MIEQFRRRLQRGQTSFEPRATDTGRVQAAIIINQQPGAGHFLSQQWTEECQQVTSLGRDQSRASCSNHLQTAMATTSAFDA